MFLDLNITTVFSKLLIIKQLMKHYEILNINRKNTKIQASHTAGMPTSHVKLSQMYGIYILMIDDRVFKFVVFVY